MSLYDIIIKPFVRNKDLDRASRIVLRFFQITGKIPGGRFLRRILNNNRPVGLQREVFCKDFYNPIGLSAGLDINGMLYNDLNNLGFSFVQVGPMNADGIRTAVEHIQEDTPDDILAVCINADYNTAFTLGYDFFDFFVIDCRNHNPHPIIEALMDIRRTEPKYKPVIIKLQNDCQGEDLEALVDFCRINGMDGVEAQNIEHVRTVHNHTKGRFPIIADGPINTAEQAYEMLEAGADLLEVRNGLIKEGPEFIQHILKYLLNKYKRKDNASTGRE